MNALLIGGQYHTVPGREILSPDSLPWVQLSRGDGRPRTNRPQQWILHKTIADDPEKIQPGLGPHGGDEQVARMWSDDPHHSGAHLVTACDGRTACLEDLQTFEAWHGNQANHLSVGHEIKEMRGGVVYQEELEAALDVCVVGCSVLGIQLQCPHKYTGKTLSRFLDGGSTLIGVFGHRDITTNRNRWDPGDHVFDMLRLRGAESFDFAARQDIDVWSRRQEWLIKNGVYSGRIDGLPGPKTTAALKQLGYPDGIYAKGRDILELPVPRWG